MRSLLGSKDECRNLGVRLPPKEVAVKSKSPKSPQVAASGALRQSQGKKGAGGRDWLGRACAGAFHEDVATRRKRQ